MTDPAPTSLKAQVYDSLQSMGAVDVLKTQIRSQILKELQKRRSADPLRSIENLPPSSEPEVKRIVVKETCTQTESAAIGLDEKLAQVQASYMDQITKERGNLTASLAIADSQKRDSEFAAKQQQMNDMAEEYRRKERALADTARDFSARQQQLNELSEELKRKERSLAEAGRSLEEQMHLAQEKATADFHRWKHSYEQKLSAEVQSMHQARAEIEEERTKLRDVGNAVKQLETTKRALTEATELADKQQRMIEHERATRSRELGMCKKDAKRAVAQERGYRRKAEMALQELQLAYQAETKEKQHLQEMYEELQLQMKQMQREMADMRFLTASSSQPFGSRSQSSFPAPTLSESQGPKSARRVEIPSSSSIVSRSLPTSLSQLTRLYQDNPIPLSNAVMDSQHPHRIHADLVKLPLARHPITSTSGSSLSSRYANAESVNPTPRAQASPPRNAPLLHQHSAEIDVLAEGCLAEMKKSIATLDQFDQESDRIRKSAEAVLARMKQPLSHQRSSRLSSSPVPQSTANTTIGTSMSDVTRTTMSLSGSIGRPLVNAWMSNQPQLPHQLTQQGDESSALVLPQSRSNSPWETSASHQNLSSSVIHVPSAQKLRQQPLTERELQLQAEREDQERLDRYRAEKEKTISQQQQQQPGAIEITRDSPVPSTFSRASVTIPDRKPRMHIYESGNNASDSENSSATHESNGDEYDVATNATLSRTSTHLSHLSIPDNATDDGSPVPSVKSEGDLAREREADQREADLEEMQREKALQEERENAEKQLKAKQQQDAEEEAKLKEQASIVDERKMRESKQRNIQEEARQIAADAARKKEEREQARREVELAKEKERVRQQELRMKAEEDERQEALRIAREEEDARETLAREEKQRADEAHQQAEAEREQTRLVEEEQTRKQEEEEDRLRQERIDREIARAKAQAESEREKQRQEQLAREKEQQEQERIRAEEAARQREADLKREEEEREEKERQAAAAKKSQDALVLSSYVETLKQKQQALQQQQQHQQHSTALSQLNDVSSNSEIQSDVSIEFEDDEF